MDENVGINYCRVVLIKSNSKLWTRVEEQKVAVPVRAQTVIDGRRSYWVANDRRQPSKFGNVGTASIISAKGTLFIAMLGWIMHFVRSFISRVAVDYNMPIQQRGQGTKWHNMTSKSIT